MFAKNTTKMFWIIATANPSIKMKQIYLDNAATTKVNPVVAKKIQEMFLEEYGNASSQHTLGKGAKSKLDKARNEIANYLGVEISEIVFTGSGTESDNLAIRGLAKANPGKKHIITSVIEHPAILETCRELEGEGYSVDYIGVNEDGIVNIPEIVEKIKEDTLVVSIMHVNNEIGTIQPIEEIGKICKKNSVYFHTDAVQSFTKIDIGIENIDLLSASGHKINAPKGIGFLYVKKNVKISPILTGGGQEFGLRSGTENVPGIIGLSEALKINRREGSVRKIRDKLIKELLKIPGTQINGSLEKRIYHNINISFYGIEGESLMLMLDKAGIFVSTGSACASTKLSESHVLKAIKTGELYIHGSLRLTLDEIKGSDIPYVVSKIKEGVEKLRKISPFKFEKEGIK
jgi:cysteine desulfurase